ncbi:MAG: cytochrome C oxidase subunit IV family protein [Firmicutes bacterium]|nr:cytochrome C oxidase subunit IV family protein [Bacillota bacterium]
MSSHMMEGGHGDGFTPHGRSFPWLHVVGYLLSLVLTIIAFLAVLNHWLSGRTLISIIMLLAVMQIGIQLFFFMHFTEGHGPRYHIMALGFALFFTIIFVGGSVWIMSFGGSQAY